MGALPKNKITRVERGKRRAGNTPTITKDFRVTAVPSNKRGLMASILTAIGLESSSKNAAKTKKRNKSVTTSTSQESRQVNKAVTPQQQAPAVKTTRVTQHKG